MKEKKYTVFIAQAIDVGWIIEKLMQDIAVSLNARGIATRVGGVSEYGGEDIVLHSRYLYAKPIESASINSIFVTHIDDMLKEMEIKREFLNFDSFVCMSPEDAELLKGLGCSSQAAFGINLPHRGMQVRPIKISIFSECYKDGRKNEDWILHYLQKLPHDMRNGVVLCLLGYNWERYCIKLAEIGVSYELYRYDRSLPSEYEYQKEILAKTDYLLYPAFDGGAMCVYDGLSAGVRLIISDVGYHKNLTSRAITFKTKEEFFCCMDEVLVDYCERVELKNTRSIEAYVNKLTGHWEALLYADRSSSVNLDYVKQFTPNEERHDVVKFYRSHYKKIDFNRFSSAAYRVIRKFVNK